MDTIKEAFLKIQTQAKEDSVFVEILLSKSDILSLSFADRKLREFSSSLSQVAGIRVVLGGAQGYAWTENVSEDSLLKAYKEALNTATTMPKNSQTIPTAPGFTTTVDMSELFDDEEISIAQKMAKAQELESAALDTDQRIVSVPYALLDDIKNWQRILNSNGLDKEFKQSYYYASSWPLAKEGSVSKMTGLGSMTRQFDKIKSSDIAKEAALAAISHLSATRLATGRYPTVLDKSVCKELFAKLDFYFSAKNIYEKKSPLMDKLGQIIASTKLTVIDDPFHREMIGVRPFDSEGSPSQATTLIENGLVKNFLTNLEYAKKMNLPHTANASRSPTTDMEIGISNLVIKKGDSKLTDLLAKYPKMIYVTVLTGGSHSGFNNSSGDFSMPAEAFLYENGKRVGPVDQFVFSGNLFEVLKNIEGLSDEHCRLDGYSPILVPDILVKELSFAGA